MKKQALSILLLLLVVVAFGGIASAATQKVLVSEAYDETVLVSPAYDEEVLVTPEQPAIPGYTVEDIPAYLEQVFDHYLVNGEYYIPHEAIYETIVVVDVPEQTIHHDAVYETVVDVPEHNITIIDVPAVPAHDEQVEANHNGWTLNSNGQVQQKKHNVPLNANYFYEGTIKNGYKVVDDHGCGSNHVWVPVFETIHVPEVPAVTHEEVVPATFKEVLVAEAYDEIIPAVTHEEQVVVQDAYTEAVPYSGNGPYFGQFGNSEDITAWSNFIYSHEGATGGWGSWVPYYNSSLVPAVTHDVPEVPAVPAVYETIHHEAVYEVIHHPAVYKEVEVVDPVAPVDPKDVPLKDIPTGGKAVGIALAILGILVVGGYIASRRK